MRSDQTSRPFAPTQDEIENAPIVPVNCCDCAERDRLIGELANYKAFVDELKEKTERVNGMFGYHYVTSLLRKHKLRGGDE